jgi:hypothetical protein
LPLDINTPKGQRSLEYAHRCYDIWLRGNPGWRYAVTPEDSDCPFDAVLIDPDNQVRAIVEQKSRDMTMVTLAKFSYEWLVTMDKLVQASQIARAMRVPLIGFLYLIPDDYLLTCKIADSQGLFTVPFRCDQTVTQRTINGGQATRGNAYINMMAARAFTFSDCDKPSAINPNDLGSVT